MRARTHTHLQTLPFTHRLSPSQISLPLLHEAVAASRHHHLLLLEAIATTTASSSDGGGDTVNQEQVSNLLNSVNIIGTKLNFNSLRGPIK